MSFRGIVANSRGSKVTDIDFDALWIMSLDYTYNPQLGCKQSENRETIITFQLFPRLS